MTSPLVLAATYNKRPLRLTPDGAVDPDKLTREFGNIEQALRGPTNLASTVYNLLDYGADPRGVGNVAVVFDRIWRDMDRAGAGGTIIVPRGRFVGTSGITVPRDDVTVSGMGPASILDLTPSTTTQSGFSAASLNRFTLRDLTLTGAMAWTILVSGGTGHVVERVTASGGVRLDGSASKGGGIFVENASGVAIRNNVLSGNGIADSGSFWDILFNYGTYQVTDSEIVGNQCTSSVFCNIGGFDVRTTRVTGNRTRNAATPSATPTTGGYGIMLYRNSGMASANVYGNLVAGNDVADTGGSGIYLQSTNRTRVAENEVRNTCQTQTDASLTVAGIAVHDSARVPVVGNLVNRSGKCGICFTSSVDVADFGSASGNVVSDCATLGIGVRGAVADLAITGNVVENTDQDGIGSWSNVAAVRVTVTGNTVRPNNAGGYRGIYAAALTTDWTIGPNTVSATSGLAVDNRGTNNHVAWPQNITSIASTTTLTSDYATVLANATGGAITVNLPACAGLTDLLFTVKKTDASANAVTLDGSGAETIDGAATYALAAQWQSVTVQSNGTTWSVL